MSKNVILRRAPRGGLPAAAKRYGGGQFIPQAIWDAEKRKAITDLPVAVAAFTDDMQFLREVYEQQIAINRLPADALPGIDRVPLERISRKMKERIRRAYTETFNLGKRAAGNLTTATADDAVSVERTRLDEYAYLREFLRDMDTSQGFMPYDQRMDYYGKAARELFWLGFVLADLGPARHIRWVLGQTEHCADCKRLADHGWYLAADFATVAREGFLPQSGRLACLGYNCQCRLEAGNSKGKP